MGKITKRLPSLATMHTMLDEAQKEAQVRLLSHDDIVYCRLLFQAFASYCKRQNLTHPSIEAHGGAVANSYRHAAETTRFSIRLQEGEDGLNYTLDIRRGRADVRPHGKSPWVHMRATLPAGVSGRDLPPFVWGTRIARENKAGMFYLEAND